jgi:hypothetical protein
MVVWSSASEQRVAPGWLRRLRQGNAKGTAGSEEARAAAPSSWERRLRRELLAGAVPYLLAHGLFWLHTRGGGGLEGTVDLGVAQLLFLLGTLLLWRVTRTLHEPPDGWGGDPRVAARCLVVAISLAFSPTAWWLTALS